MLQKSGKLTSWGNGRFIPLLTGCQVLIHSDFWSIKLMAKINQPLPNIPPPQTFHGFIARPYWLGAPRWLRPGPSNRLAVDLMLSGFRSWPTWRSPLRQISLTSFPVPLASCSMRKGDSVEPGGVERVPEPSRNPWFGTFPGTAPEPILGKTP